MNALRMTAVFVHLDHVFLYAQDEKFLGFKLNFDEKRKKKTISKNTDLLRMKFGRTQMILKDKNM